MHKNSVTFLLGLLFFTSSVKAQVTASNHNIDFINFKNADYWYGPAAWLNDYKFIQFEYENTKQGWARIIFYPKTLKIKSLMDSLDRINRNDLWTKTYAVRNVNLFNVWLVFVDKKYDEKKEDAGDVTVFRPVYPCEAELFRLENGHWKFIRAEEIAKKGKEFNLFPQVNY